MANVTGVSDTIKSGDVLGGLGINFGSLGSIFLWIAIIIVVIGGIAGLIIWWVVKKSYNKNIWIFGRVGGVPMLKLIDKGKLMAFGMAGDRLMQLKITKKFLPPPQIQMGKDIFWYWEREDGEYVNFSLEDIDEKQKKAGAYYVDVDMRMQRLGIEKNLRDRMEKKSWLEKYGSVIAGAIFVIMVTVCLVVLFSKLTTVTTSMDTMASSVKSMADAVQKFYVEKSGGESPSGNSGLIPVIFLPLFWRMNKWQ